MSNLNSTWINLGELKEKIQGYAQPKNLSVHRFCYDVIEAKLFELGLINEIKGLKRNPKTMATNQPQKA